MAKLDAVITVRLEDVGPLVNCLCIAREIIDETRDSAEFNGLKHLYNEWDRSLEEFDKAGDEPTPDHGPHHRRLPGR